MKWISVKDRLPEKDADYLTFNDTEQIWINNWRGKWQEYCREDLEEIYDVTHWMSLPDNP